MADKLGAYRGKRDFEATPEPAGGERAQAGDELPRFVVQEHHARRLHWDLRLERDGVLLSWAVPKGLPMDPGRNHLAVRTEDHPLGYLEFEGEIPKGEYGAGRIAIWDRGGYETHEFRDDKVTVTLHGERARGRYALFRTKGDDWMIHRMDPPAAGREPLPEGLRPMLARLAGMPEDEEGWAYELKWDGVRALCYVEGGRIRLESRNGRDITARYPELSGLGRELGAREAVLDGEIVALDREGRPSFERLQRRMHLGSESAVRRVARDVPVTYLLFDVLHLDGRSTVGLAYRERRELLAGLALEGDAWRTPDFHEGQGADLLALTGEMGLEGILAKRLDSRYEPGRRSAAWLKVKNVDRQELVIGGYTPGEGGRRGRLGALLVGFYEDGRLTYAGRVGTGFTEATLRELGDRLEPLRRRTSPFEGRQPPKGSLFVEPELVAEIEFREWTRTRTLRAPSFKGLRADRDPREVVFEAPASREEVAAEARGASVRPGEIEVDGRSLRLSNLDKVLYPRAGFTKGEVIDYYREIAPVLLPHLAERPLTLKRYPDGVEADFFYEKRCPAHKPDWLRTTRAGDIDFCVVDDLASLVWVANLASLELHPSLSKGDGPPTTLAFDLDPGAPAGLAECAGVALRLREMFERLGLDCFAKTSGGKGLQVYVPLNTDTSYEETKPFAHAVARLLEEEQPDLVVSRMQKQLRKGKVLVDWSQNDRHKTTVCVYSLRAREQPTVSTPVTWEEVEAGELVFDARAALERAERRGDLFAPVLELRQELPAL